MCRGGTRGSVFYWTRADFWGLCETKKSQELAEI
jgi:hypothetical protein